MVKEIENRVLRHLEWEEMAAVTQACQLLEKAFKRKIYKVTINPDQTTPSEVHGVMVAFDNREVR